MAVLFILTAALSFAITGKRLYAWEHMAAVGRQRFTGTVIHAGVGTPGDPGGGRWQTIRTPDGMPAMLWMKYPARLGDRVEGAALFRTGEGTRNPGGYSSRLWLWSKGAALCGLAEDCEVCRVDHVLWTIRRFPDCLRDRVRRCTTSFFHADGGPLLASLTLGDTSLMSGIEQYHLRFSGLSHLTSISGTHLYYFLMPYQAMARRRGHSFRKRIISRVLLALIPGLLCGWKSGIARASLTVCVIHLDTACRKQHDPVNTLLFVGIILILINPYGVWGQAFWMSLSAAGAVSCVRSLSSGWDTSLGAYDRAKEPSFAGRFFPGEKCRRLFHTVLLCLKRAAVFSLAAQLAILPYVWMTSPGFQILSPVLNAAAVPIAAALTVGAYPAVIILSLIPAGSRFTEIGGSLFAAALRPGTGVLQWLSGWPASVREAFIPVRWAVPAALLILMCAVYYSRRIYAAKFRRIAAFLTALCLTASLVHAAVKEEGWRVFFLDVGQGDATLIISPEGSTCLIDGGGQGHGFRTIIPAMRSYSLSAVNLAIVTHAHSDHAAGIIELIECGLVEHLCLPAEPVHAVPRSGDETWEEDLTEIILMTASRHGVPCHVLKAGDRLESGGMAFDVLNPGEDRTDSTLNDDSLVLRMRMGGICILFTGDLTEKGEKRILGARDNLLADILHVPHHGSKYSSSEPFLQAVSPQKAVISVGRDNRYSHPHPSVLERLRAEGCDVFRTDVSGAVFLIIRHGKGTIKEWMTP